MLRSGYTGNEVLQEIATRPLLEPLTSEGEKALRTAGADQRFVDALKSSHPALSPAEALAAHQQQAQQEQRAAASAIQQAELLRSQQAPPPGAPAKPVGAAPTPPNDPQALEKMLHGKLVVFRDEKFASASIDALQGKTLIGLYYSRFMSKAGSDFSKDLAQFYRTTGAKHPEFEIVLVSSDRSAFAMENMIRQEKMPWPALAFDQISQVPMISRFMDNTGASRLMVVDNLGRLHADYHISVLSNNLPLVLPDLAKVIEDPHHASVLAPPVASAPAAKATATPRAQ